MSPEDYGFHFHVRQVDEIATTDGHKAFAIYLDIANLDAQARQLNVAPPTYVTTSGEQIQQLSWLQGYLIGSCRIKGNAHGMCCFLFDRTRLRQMQVGDTLDVEVSIPDKNVRLLTQFTLKNATNKTTWAAVSAKVADSLDSNGCRDLTRIIERMEAFEERLGVRLEAVSARIENRNGLWSLDVFGEVHPREGTSLHQDLRVELTVYDHNGLIMYSIPEWVKAEGFFGYCTLHWSPILPSNSVSKIRLVPRLT